MPDHTPTPTPSTVAPPPGAPNIDLVRWALDRLDHQDLDSLQSFWTTDSTVQFPTGTCRGRAEITAYFRQVFDALADFSLKIVAIAESGDDVLVHWHLTGRHVGTFVGIDATGRDVDLEGFDHFVLDHGTVATNTVRFDQMEFARQIRLLPADGSPADRALKGAFNAATHAMDRLRRRRH